MDAATRRELDDVVARALAEDVGTGDLTTAATAPPGARARATITQKAPGVVFGVDAAQAAFVALDPDAAMTVLGPEGEWREHGPVLQVEGDAAALLAAERTALNLLQRLSGVATLTARYVTQVQGTGARILDTRKTTPGLRALEKYAVRTGGGTNHRFALYDGVMLKDNHLAILAAQGYGLAEAIARTRAAVGPMVRVEVEVESVEQASVAAAAGADMILLDNMPPDQLRAAVAAIAGRAISEASGGITLSTIRAVAESGVDYISVGALTHSARALDIGLDM
jgi:nicotinate-nucleotide pyrophosphorylase (carboxylating)